ncbi:hypothetical protein V8E53_013558, partial [Lactarius tabidus]
EDVDWARFWSRSVVGNALPANLFFDLRQADVHAILTLTDNAPQGLNKASPLSFICATQLGLFTSSTPFVTGRPYTLIFNGSVRSSGAVGLALSGGLRPVTQTAFPGLRAITAPFKVTQYGNLINELENASPTALLVSAMEKCTLAGHADKDDEFYLGLWDGELWQLYHIIAGGPSRGTMILDTETAPGEGTCVQVCRAIAISRRPRESCRRTPSFVASSQVSDNALIPLEEGDDHDITVLEDTFVATSKNGFMLRRGDESPSTPHLASVTSIARAGAYIRRETEKNEDHLRFRPFITICCQVHSKWVFATGTATRSYGTLLET